MLRLEFSRISLERIAMGFAPSRIVQLAIGAAIGFFSVAVAPSRAAFVVNIAPDGLGDVVASGTGSIDTTDLTNLTSGTVSTTARINPAHSVLVFGTPGNNITQWDGTITGPATFGTENGAEIANSTSGTFLFFNPEASPPLIYLPESYPPESTLSETDTWTNATLSSLGLTPGTYQWNWGTGADADSYTINIGSSPVPEPASLGLLGVGAAALLGRRRRVI
jgi:hypothetical protein